jgi:Methyltransferase domain
VTWYSTKLGQFTYFSQQVGSDDWRGKNVLDFGGNIGNMLRDPNSTIDPERYWCLDVDEASVQKGRKLFPQAHWMFYDRQCFFFNPNGKRFLPLPELDQRFDYIVAYSVFPNTSRADMLDLVPRLESLLAPGGALAFTFIDARHKAWPVSYEGNNFHWRLERERGELSTPELRGMLADAEKADWCTLINGEKLFIETDEIGEWPPEEQRTCHVFHSVEHVKRTFPHGSIQPPVNGEMQHCCVIRK